MLCMLCTLSGVCGGKKKLVRGGGSRGAPLLLKVFFMCAHLLQCTPTYIHTLTDHFGCKNGVFGN